MTLFKTKPIAISIESKMRVTAGVLAQVPFGIELHITRNKIEVYGGPARS